jgi:hypothetical protein
MPALTILSGLETISNGSQAGSDSIPEFLYTFCRGSFFFHTTSLPLMFASREAERPPFICPKP